jgi:hypothetical protein
VTSSPGQHLASYPETPAGSRALAAHLRNDHGIRQAIYRRLIEDHAVHSAMHAVAHQAEQGELLCTCNAFHRPHPHHGYRRHNSAAARALARHLRGEGFQVVDIDPGDPGAADLLAAWDATEGQTFGPSPQRDW